MSLPSSPWVPLVQELVQAPGSEPKLVQADALVEEQEQEQEPQLVQMREQVRVLMLMLVLVLVLVLVPSLVLQLQQQQHRPFAGWSSTFGDHFE